MPFAFILPLSKQKKKQIEEELWNARLIISFLLNLKLSTFTYMDFTEDELILESPFQMALQKCR